MKIIHIRPDDYLTLKGLAEREKVPAAEIIHRLLARHKKSPYTQIVIDVFCQYWQNTFGVKYTLSPKDGAAAKQIGTKLASHFLEKPDPQTIGQVWAVLLKSLKNTFYYEKELSALNGGLNSIIAKARENQPHAKGGW
jgi:hypothetical protein